jgi:hypothetical protein
MKISLNKANKLRNALENLKIEVPVSGTVRTDQSTVEIMKGFDQAVKTTSDLIDKNVAKIMATFLLRSMIYDANANSELSLIMNAIARHEKSLGYLNSLVDSRTSYTRTPASSLDDVLAAITHANKLEEADPKLAQAPKSIVISLLTKQLQEEINKTIAKTRLELEELKEKRNELNHSITIELPKDLVEFLREYSLIK